MRNITITISGGSKKENRRVCEHCCGQFSRGQIAQPSDPVAEQNGAYSFSVNVDGSLSNQEIADKIYPICSEGQMVSIDGTYYEE